MKVIKIMVPLDGSPRAEAALPKTVELASQSAAARLVLVRAVDPAVLPRGFSSAQVAAINEAAAYLRNVAERLRREGIDMVSRSVWYATAGPAIVEAARTVKPDLIVMVSGAERLIPGSVVEFIRQRTRAPIVLVPAGKTPVEAPAGRSQRTFRFSRQDRIRGMRRGAFARDHRSVSRVAASRTRASRWLLRQEREPVDGLAGGEHVPVSTTLPTSVQIQIVRDALVG